MSTAFAPPSPRRAVAWLVVAAAVLSATGCTTDSAGEPQPETGVRPSVFDAVGAAPAAPELRPAVTHLGREVLPHVGLVVRGRARRLSRALGGVEVVRFHVDEVLRSAPWDRVPDTTDGPILTVFCGEAGMLPRVGDEAVLLVARRPRSPNHDVVQVIDLSGRDGPERLAALRTYLAIEEIQDDVERARALRDYLRRAVRDRRKWTRSNAALEYGSLAAARPEDLGVDDAAVLRTAVLGAGERDVRLALQRALGAAERNTREPPRIAMPGAAGPAVDDAPDLDMYMLRYLETRAPLERRQVVVDAALVLEDGAVPLLRRALSDDDPRVREAAAAAAGQLRLTTLGHDLLPMLARDESLVVRRSVVRALGYVRETSAVPTLQALGRADGEIGRDACFALARIRDAAAVTALGRLLRTAEDERREDLEFLLSDAFVQQEVQFGRPLD